MARTSGRRGRLRDVPVIADRTDEKPGSPEAAGIDGIRGPARQLFGGGAADPVERASRRDLRRALGRPGRRPRRLDRNGGRDDGGGSPRGRSPGSQGLAGGGSRPGGSGGLRRRWKSARNGAGRSEG